jgi:hypothetical protein
MRCRELRRSGTFSGGPSFCRDIGNKLKGLPMRAIGLWLLGVPIWIVILLAIFTDWV